MNRRLLAALAGSAVLVATILPSTAIAADPPQRGQRVAPARLAEIDPSFRPYLADANRQLSVVLELTDPAALDVDGLSKAQQKTRAGTLRTKQQGMDKAIKAAGGKVTGRYQYAYNGVRVRATGQRLKDLAAIKGVVAIRPLRTYTIDNTNAVPYVGAPTAWQANGATGDGVTIAVIDTGIDYTHADFGGPGTRGYGATRRPTAFPTAKVIAGYDFAGDDYDADGEDSSSTTPVPDPDPLDCGDHGSHVAGTAAGQGVLADHSTYSGPYDSSLYADSGKFVVGPGVAPEAKLVALKVFGCEGSTSLVVEALEWVAAYNVEHADGIDVVNMSLGSEFGSNTDPDAVATNNLVDTGVVVVASAGNSNAVPYVTGAPAAVDQGHLGRRARRVPGHPDGHRRPARLKRHLRQQPERLPGPARERCAPRGRRRRRRAQPRLCRWRLRRGVGRQDRRDPPRRLRVRRQGAAAQAAGAIGVIVVNRDRHRRSGRAPARSSATTPRSSRSR